MEDWRCWCFGGLGNQPIDGRAAFGLSVGRSGLAGNKAEAFHPCILLESFEARPASDRLARFHFDLAQGKARFELGADEAIFFGLRESRFEALSCVRRFADRGADLGRNDLHPGARRTTLAFARKLQGAANCFPGLA